MSAKKHSRLSRTVAATAVVEQKSSYAYCLDHKYLLETAYFKLYKFFESTWYPANSEIRYFNFFWKNNLIHKIKLVKLQICLELLVQVEDAIYKNLEIFSEKCKKCISYVDWDNAESWNFDLKRFIFWIKNFHRYWDFYNSEICSKVVIKVF
jgi:hypothetical protein